MLGVLILTIFIAPDVKGSRSWLVLGPVSIQPAEFGKFVTALMLGWLFNSYNFKFTKPKNFFKAVAIVIVPIILIILQKETGSALVYLSFVIVFYREGMTGLVMIAGLCAILFFVLGIKFGDTYIGITELGTALVMQLIMLVQAGMVYFFSKNRIAALIILGGTIAIDLIFYFISLNVPINFTYVGLGICAISIFYEVFLFLQSRSSKFLTIAAFTLCFVAFLFSVDYAFDNILEPHQQIRIKVSLGMEEELRGAGYNVNQAKIAIGSGGVWGKGLLNGTQTKLK